jgi:hypothetical protein
MIPLNFLHPNGWIFYHFHPDNPALGDREPGIAGPDEANFYRNDFFCGTTDLIVFALSGFAKAKVTN